MSYLWLVNGWFSAQISICPGPGRKMLIDWVLVLTSVGSGSSYNVLPVFCYFQTQWVSGDHCFCLCSVCNLGTSKQYLNPISDQLKSIFLDERWNKFHETPKDYITSGMQLRSIFSCSGSCTICPYLQSLSALECISLWTWDQPLDSRKTDLIFASEVLNELLMRIILCFVTWTH